MKTRTLYLLLKYLSAVFYIVIFKQV